MHSKADGYVFAFGAEELCELLQDVSDFRGRVELTGRGDGGSGTEMACEVRVVRVRPQEGVTVAVRLGSRVVAQKEFRICSPWPAWFTATTRPTPHWAWLIPCFLILLATGWGVWAYLTRLDKPERVGLLATGVLLILAWLLIPHPVPHTAHEIGGTVEFVVPADESFEKTPVLRRISNEACLSLFRKLTECSPDATPQRSDQTSTGPSDYLQLLRELLEWNVRWPDDSPTLSTNEFWLSEMRYVITPCAYLPGGKPPHSARRGRLVPSEESAFRTALEQIRLAGEPDRPSGLLSPKANYSFVAVVTEPDHGQLTCPDESVTASDVPRAALALIDFTRDGNVARGLHVHDRIEWVRQHSANAVFVFPDGTIEPLGTVLRRNASKFKKLDQHGQRAADMAALRIIGWSEETFHEQKVRDISDRFTEMAWQTFPSNRQETSRTSLSLTYSLLRMLLLCLVAMALAGIPIWLRRGGMFDWRTAFGSLARWFAIFTGAVVFIPALFLVVAANDVARDAWCYGTPYWSGTRLGTWCGMLALGLAATVAMVFFLLQLFSPTAFHRHVAGRAATWPRRKENDRRRRTCQAGLQCTGLILLALSFGWVGTCPVWVKEISRNCHRPLPTDYSSSALAGWGLCFAAVLLLWVLSPLSRKAHTRRPSLGDTPSRTGVPMRTESPPLTDSIGV
jgi:hypothetical protein